MFGNLIIFLVLAAVAVQCYVPYDVVDLPASYNDDHGKTTHQIKDMIENMLKGAENALDKLHNDSSLKIKQVIDTAQAKNSRQFDNLLGKIKKMKEEAEKVKADIKECLNGHEGELENLNKELHKKVEACGQDVINKSKTLVEDEKKKLQVSVGLLDKLIADFDACGTNAEGDKCKAKVIGELTQAYREATHKINDSFSKVIPTTSGFASTAKKCVLKQSRQLVMAELKTTKVIVTCIKDKIHPLEEA